MEAPIAHNSNVKVRFGDHAHHTQLSLSFILDVFSAQQKKIRQTLNQNLKINLQSTALVFQLVIGSGNSSEIAKQLNESQVVKSVNENSPSQVIYYGFENKVYIVVKGQQLTSFFEPHEATLKGFKEDLGDFQPIQLHINSGNTLQTISALIKEKNSFSFGWLNSLQLSFGFSKTIGTSKLVSHILQNIFGISGVSKLTKSFRQLNLELNCSSAKILNEFPKVQLRPVNSKPSNEVIKIISEANVQNVRLFILNESVFLKGDFKFSGLEKLLATLFI